MSPIKRTRIAAAGIFAAVSFFSGCASSSPRKAQRDLDGMVLARSGADLRAGEGREEAAARGATLSLLKAPLTAEGAVQLALLNNHALRARLEDAGVAQADLLHGGLLENPRIHAGWRYPNGGGAAGTGREMGIAVNVMDALTLPLRLKLADAQFEQAKFRISHDVLGLAAEVKTAFYELQAEGRRLELRRTALETIEAAAKLSAGQRQAGNVSALDAARQQAALDEAKLEATREEAQAARERERLSLLMGVQDMTEWTLSPTPDELPPSDPELKSLEDSALERRWDLAAARKEPLVLEEALRVSRFGWAGGLSAGVDSEKDFDGKFGVGPAIEWSVPLFDRQQASSARIKARSRQSRSSIEALQSQIRYEVRAARTSLVAARQAVQTYRETLIPLQEKISDESLKHYNFMLLGVYQLLQAKRDELQVRRAFIDAQRDYWTAWAELERAVGGRIPGPGGKQ